MNEEEKILLKESLQDLAIKELKHYQDLETAEDEGARASYEGKTIEDNPYKLIGEKGSNEWFNSRGLLFKWRSGYHYEENNKIIECQKQEIEELKKQVEKYKDESWDRIIIYNICVNLLHKNPLFRGKWKKSVETIFNYVRS